LAQKALNGGGTAGWQNQLLMKCVRADSSFDILNHFQACNAFVWMETVRIVNEWFAALDAVQANQNKKPITLNALKDLVQVPLLRSLCKPHILSPGRLLSS
jgi:hypothetical protein